MRGWLLRLRLMHMIMRLHPLQRTATVWLTPMRSRQYPDMALRIRWGCLLPGPVRATKVASVGTKAPSSPPVGQQHTAMSWPRYASMQPANDFQW